MSPDVVVVPSTPALLPAHAGLTDPVADLRAACTDAVAWLVGRNRDLVRVVTVAARADNVGRGVPDPPGARVARYLLSVAGYAGRVEVTIVPARDAPARDVPARDVPARDVPARDVPAEPAGLLVVANGSATRGERAPGHLDTRAAAFDAAVGNALREGDPAALRSLDADLGAALWAFDVPALTALGRLVDGDLDAVVTYDDDPYGVQYWVVRWSCGS